jgi:hypothetical protein
MCLSVVSNYDHPLDAKFGTHYSESIIALATFNSVECIRAA